MKTEKGPTARAINSFAGPRDIVVKGERIAPELQRTVSFTGISILQSGRVRKHLASVFIVPRPASAWI